MSSIKFLCAIVSTFAFLSMGSTAWAMPNNCADILLGAGDRHANPTQRVVETYRRILSETDWSVLGVEELAEMKRQGTRRLSGFFFLVKTGGSERIALSRGLKKILAYIDSHISDTETLISDLQEVLEDTIKSRLVQGQFANQVRDQRAVVRMFETSKGAVFEQVEWPGLGPAWKDPDGLVWSKTLDKKDFNHEGDVKGDQIVNSAATRACAAVGGRLPTIEAVKRLKTFFDERPARNFLTDLGTEDFRKMFPKKDWFWTSSLYANDNYSAYIFCGVSGRTDAMGRNFGKVSVICIK